MRSAPAMMCSLLASSGKRANSPASANVATVLTLDSMARLVDAASKLMAASVASLRDGAIASTAAVSNALGMVRRTGTSARAGG